MTAKETSDRTTADGVGELAQRPPEPPHRPIPTETMFELLSHRDRRMLLSELVESGGTATVTGLLDRIQARSNDTAADEARTQLEIAVWHVHLPKLRDAGVVAGGNGDGKTLTLSVDSALLVPFLDLSTSAGET
jgi:hypothetical protein